ncbi:hypothetical protein IFM89_037418 [Coptis chinensis]|uniref:Uncharacterized protein n=1 Tax=Coptis chinensis TaxID=261450 RepID=A0A835IZH4_9MAGN|nr:hypothetical protein IFM89_037418 [Coptis chinensis]
MCIYELERKFCLLKMSKVCKASGIRLCFGMDLLVSVGSFPTDVWRSNCLTKLHPCCALSQAFLYVYGHKRFLVALRGTQSRSHFPLKYTVKCPCTLTAGYVHKSVG